VPVPSCLVHAVNPAVVLCSFCIRASEHQTIVFIDEHLDIGNIAHFCNDLSGLHSSEILHSIGVLPPERTSQPTIYLGS
jgi:hypothetical protein